jgi:hypothetical protein
LINAWLDEVSAVAQRPTLVGDDSSVRALGRAIADSLAPRPPHMPGAPKRGHSIPTPPGYPSPAVGGLPRRRLTTPSGFLHVAPLNAELLKGMGGSGSKVTTLPSTTPSPSAAEVRSRLLRARRSKDSAPPGGLGASLSRPPSARTSPVDLAPPLPLGALLHAPPEQTRRSSPPPPAPVPSAVASAAALPQALDQESGVSPLPAPAVEEPKAPEPSVVPRVSSRRDSSSRDSSARASLPFDGPSLPPDETPWAPKKRPKRWDERFATTRVRGWLVLCLVSVLAGGGLAYWGRTTELLGSASSGLMRSLERGIGAPPATALEVQTKLEEATTAPSALQPVLEADAKLAAQMALPSESRLAQLPAAVPGPALAVPSAKTGDRPLPKKTTPALAAPARPSALAAAPPPAVAQAAPALRPLTPPAAPAPVVIVTPSAPVAAAPVAAAPVAAAPVAAAPVAAVPGGSRLSRARRCLAEGNTRCVIALLEGNASTEPELELWIETLRADGRGSEARTHMQRYVAQYPEGRRASAYRRILSHAE